MKEVFQKSVLIIILAIGFCLGATAQNFTVQAPARVYKGEKFAVTYRLSNAQGGEPRVAQINGCKLLFGPSVTTRQSYQVTNKNSVE